VRADGCLQPSHKDAATDKAHETRDKISQSVQNAKQKVNEKIDDSRSAIHPDALRPESFFRLCAWAATVAMRSFDEGWHRGSKL
jgi:ElaB/YqjD/DUF883 family membrane-anchored ribosome-binding protein